MEKQQKLKSDLVKAIELRDKLKRIVEKELDQLPETLGKLEPKDRLQFTYKFLQLLVAPPRPVDHTAGEPLSFNF